MFKYILSAFVIPCMAMAQQNVTHYAVPYLKIEDALKILDNETIDFGYNISLHTETPFLKEGYYMWVDNQWYEIINAEAIFVPYNEQETLFTISKSNEQPLKIKDIEDIVYLYPVEALDAYKVSLNDFTALSKTVEKQEPVLYERAGTKEPVKILDVEEVVETVVVKELTEDNEDNKPSVELPKLNPDSENEVMITSENPESVLLDVMEVVEFVKHKEIPFTVEAKIEVPIEDFSGEIIELREKQKEEIKASASNTLIIPNPSNDYEIAVNEGFDGTVTEWIEMIDEQGRKSAYEQAVDKGFEGTEQEWMRMLWGRQESVEVAKRNKTTAIITEWIQSLQTSKGNSPYELALKHGFYGTFTEWIESVVGTDGEEAYEHAKTQGFEGNYKEWIEKQLNQSNQENLRKERLAQTQMFVAPNIPLPMTQEDVSQPLEFNLYEYYNRFYGAPVISSGSNTIELEIQPSDLEYQITWFERDKIKILELTKEGVVKYLPLEDVENTSTTINVRYLLK